MKIPPCPEFGLQAFISTLPDKLGDPFVQDPAYQ